MFSPLLTEPLIDTEFKKKLCVPGWLDKLKE